MRFPKPVVYESERYRAFIRTQPCFICDKDYTVTIVECHHESMGTGEQKQGGKCLDVMSLPLCWGHHRERTTTTAERFFLRYGFSPQQVFLAMLRYVAEYLKSVRK